MDNNGFFYNTLPQNTQNFDAVLSGVGRSLREMGRSTQYLPYDIVGAPVDLTTLLLRPLGYNVQAPVGGSDWLIELARKYGIADKPTGSGLETLTRLAVGIPSPVAVPRAAAKVGQMLERTSDITTEQANRAADALVRQITGNPQATAPRVLQETAMPFMQAVAPKAPSLLDSPAKSPLGFYSALEEATIPLQNKGTGQQYLAQIEKTAGVKPEEIKWTGLDEFLQSRQNVTKQEIQDYLAANRVDVQEVQLGSQVPAGWRVEQNPQTGAFAAIDPQNRVAGIGESRDMALANAGYSAPQASSTKFSQYTLPGGENYREILLTLPVKEERVFPTIEEWHDKTHVRPFSEVQQNPRLLEIAQRQYERDKSAFVRNPNVYYSSHFQGQPNILAHMRVNDRVVDGKKTLFIEEVQSDWHQAGRKKGYATKENLESWYNQNKLENDPPFAALNNEQLRVIEANRMAGMGGSNLVPDAPFKTSWHELTLKRAIQEAAEKGYDKIAFTTGKTQAERYDLSKQVRKIDVEAVEEVPNLYFVDVDVVGRGKMNLEVENGVVREGEFAGKALEDVVGKEIAEKVFAVPQSSFATLKGDDLRIGGEGMKGFYDNILPKSLEKLGKKFDAKVTKTKMKAGQDTVEPGMVAPGVGMEFPGKTIPAPEVEVWTMDITPKMRESVLTKGQPLFAATPAVPLGLLGGDEGE